MRVGLVAVDSKHPNLALMKISAYHKNQGDTVEWLDKTQHYDIVYMSKIFNYTKDFEGEINAGKIVRGGTGYDIHSCLPDTMEYLTPDYTIYPEIDNRTAYGFLTRGCPNKCKWCVVPRKEGPVRPYMDVDEVATDGRNKLVLMDNNILACEYGLQQIEKIAERGYRVDFNQALDARLVTDEVAKLLAKCRWLNQIRFGCDTPKQIVECERAMKLIDGYRGKPASYLMYTMIGSDFDEAVSRLSHWKTFRRVRIVAQPFRDVDNPEQRIPKWQKDLARWAMRREYYASCDFNEFQPRKNFCCSQYFSNPETRTLLS